MQNHMYVALNDIWTFSLYNYIPFDILYISAACLIMFESGSNAQLLPFYHIQHEGGVFCFQLHGLAAISAIYYAILNKPF